MTGTVLAMLIWVGLMFIGSVVHYFLKADTPRDDEP